MLNRRDAENAETYRKNAEPSDQINVLTDGVIGAAIAVHKVLGPGYLESVYEVALSVELASRQIAFKRQHRFNTEFMGHIVGSGQIDLLVDDRLIVELKSVDFLLPIYQAQIV